jgi:DNA-directed RNA polymerase subunit RPC12/RpoP
MARLVPRDGYVKQTEINSQSGKVTYSADRQGLYSVDNPNHIRALKAEGFIEESLNPYTPGDTGRGYTCTQCGFGSWFRKCSRCGNETPDPQTDGEIEYGDSGNN